MNNKTAFCEICRKDTPFFTKERSVLRTFRDENVEFKETIVLCDECGNEVFIHGLSDKNLLALYNTYRLKNDIIIVGDYTYTD